MDAKMTIRIPAQIPTLKDNLSLQHKSARIEENGGSWNRTVQCGPNEQIDLTIDGPGKPIYAAARYIPEFAGQKHTSPPTAVPKIPIDPSFYD